MMLFSLLLLQADICPWQPMEELSHSRNCMKDQEREARMAERGRLRQGCRMSTGFVLFESGQGSFAEWLGDGIGRHGLYLHAEGQ